MSNEPTNLPALIDTAIVQQDKENGVLYSRLQAFAKLQNKEPEKEKLQEHPVAKGAFYLPISYIEMTLDELYFGLWKTENFRTQVIANELTGIIELSVFHPVIKQWITRTGTGATQIMVDKFPEEYPQQATKEQKEAYNLRRNQWALNLDNKKPAALEMGGITALKADCVKNAALSLGKYFGRDVNRLHKDTYQPLIGGDYAASIKSLRAAIQALFDSLPDTPEKSDMIDLILQTEAAGANTVEFYTQTKNTLESWINNL